MPQSAILLIAAGSPCIEQSALLQAIELAQQPGMTLHCLCVYDELRWSSRLNALLPNQASVRKALAQNARQTLGKQIEAAAPSLQYDVSVGFGHVSLQVIDYCQHHPVSFVVKAAKTPHWTNIFFDSEDLHLLRDSPVPVWLTAPDNSQQIKSVAIALDFDHESEPESRALNSKLLRTAIEIARRKKASLHLINVLNIGELSFATLWADDPDKLEQELLSDEKVTRQAAMQRLLDDIKCDTPDAFEGLKYSIHLKQGTPSETIAATVKKLSAPMLVMGSVARVGVAGLIIGNTAESTLLQIQCPIVVMKPDGFPG